MRELILLRHAHAEAAGPGMDDGQRPLSATGLAEARAAGKKPSDFCSACFTTRYPIPIEDSGRPR